MSTVGEDGPEHFCGHLKEGPCPGQGVSGEFPGGGDTQKRSGEEPLLIQGFLVQKELASPGLCKAVHLKAEACASTG